MGKKIAESILGRTLAYASQLAPSELYREVLPRMPVTMKGSDFLAAYGGVDDALSKIEGDREYRVADSLRFPVEENHRCGLMLSLLRSVQTSTSTASDASTASILAQVGELMMQGHAGYTAIGLGAAETDAMIAKLASMGPSAGIFGARVSGGGSGGTVVVLCTEDALPALQKLGSEMTFGEAFPGLIF